MTKWWKRSGYWITLAMIVAGISGWLVAQVLLLAAADRAKMAEFEELRLRVLEQEVMISQIKGATDGIRLCPKEFELRIANVYLSDGVREAIFCVRKDLPK